ncbi:transposase [Deinococcus apachensis]|uniref:transposase n=1 Tax=Deinococcus apachensis TaxID=309886 RepID=UPI000364FAF2|nr:transposase [Deinococcus apachensis]
MRQRKFSEEQIIKLLQDAKKGEQPIEELCREAGCSTASFSTWKAKYGDATVDEAKRLRQLERENERLLKLVGQQRLELEGMKEVLAKKR